MESGLDRNDRIDRIDRIDTIDNIDNIDSIEVSDSFSPEPFLRSHPQFAATDHFDVGEALLGDITRDGLDALVEDVDEPARLREEVAFEFVAGCDPIA